MATINNINVGNVFMFIVPNAVERFSELHPMVRKYLDPQLTAMGIDYTPEDHAVQVWISSDEHHDWACNGAPTEVVKELRRLNGIEGKASNMLPVFIPASILENAREGETVDLGHLKGVVTEQLPYRYGSFGKFEKVLKDLLNA
jgi:hypothetical protein